jgi:hypothetical protein
VRPIFADDNTRLYPRTDIATRRRHHTFGECICLLISWLDY